jgi:hypothetical protein
MCEAENLNYIKYLRDILVAMQGKEDLNPACCQPFDSIEKVTFKSALSPLKLYKTLCNFSAYRHLNPEFRLSTGKR